MRVLVAEDEPIMLKMLAALLKEWGYEAIPVKNGDSAWDVLKQDDAPLIVLSDWRMPGLRGDALCRRIREEMPKRPVHIILITAAATAMEDQVAGLHAGADDFILKPCDPRELQARVRAGERIINIHCELQQKVRELQNALNQVKQLQGLLPICMDCKRIRDDKSYWHQVENYIGAKTGAEFTHSLCPTCMAQRLKSLETGIFPASEKE